MKRTRKEPYYFLTSIGTIDYTVDNNSDIDKERHRIGNYFNSHEAREAQQKFLSILKPNGIINKFRSLVK